MKPLRVIRRDAFRRDLIEHYCLIAEDQPAAADTFARRVEELIADLSTFPLSARAWEPAGDRLEGVRVRCVKGFKVLVFYQVLDDYILMLRALHGARDDLMAILGDELGPFEE
jgi:plasmid stabilization system protein ParE